MWQIHIPVVPSSCDIYSAILLILVAFQSGNGIAEEKKKLNMQHQYKGQKKKYFLK